MLQEPDAHVVTRYFRTGARALLGLSLNGTVVCLFFFRQDAYLAAIPIPVLYAVLALTSYLEFRSRAANLRAVGQSTPSQAEVDVDVQTVGIITLLKVIGVLAVGTFIVAATIFELPMIGAAAAVLLLLALLILGPYLPLYFSESERDELEQLKAEQNLQHD